MARRSLTEIAAAVAREVPPPASGGGRLWQRVYRARIAAGREFCRRCGAAHTPGNPLTFDHLWPAARGGRLTLDNTAILCRCCNARKGATIWAEMASLADEEYAAAPHRQWTRLARIDQLRVQERAWCEAGPDRCAITLGRSPRRGTTCVCCPLTGTRRVLLGHDPAQVLAHIHAHRAAGHHVPAWVDDLIRHATGAPHAAA